MVDETDLQDRSGRDELEGMYGHGSGSRDGGHHGHYRKARSTDPWDSSRDDHVSFSLDLIKGFSPRADDAKI